MPPSALQWENRVSASQEHEPKRKRQGDKISNKSGRKKRRKDLPVVRKRWHSENDPGSNGGSRVEAQICRENEALSPISALSKEPSTAAQERQAKLLSEVEAKALKGKPRENIYNHLNPNRTSPRWERCKLGVIGLVRRQELRKQRERTDPSRLGFPR